MSRCFFTAHLMYTGLQSNGQFVKVKQNAGIRHTCWYHVSKYLDIMSKNGTKTNKRKSFTKEVNLPDPKRNKPALSGCEINNEGLFDEAFGPEYQIERTPDLKMTAWESQECKAKIRTWLVTYGPHFASLLPKIMRNCEPSLYPLLVNALLPILQVSDCIVKISNVMVERLTEEQMGEVAEEIVHRSHQNSLSTEPVGPSGTIDTTDIKEVREFLIFMEEMIKSKNFENKGRVELMIHNRAKPKGEECTVVLEAKKTMTDDDDAGFFQTAAYMVIGNVQYGVYTSHKTWKFLRMDCVPVEPGSSAVPPPPHCIIRHTDMYDLVKSSYKELDEQAVIVYAHLLEMFDVPNTTDLVASAVAATAELTAAGKRMTALLEK